MYDYLKNLYDNSTGDIRKKSIIQMISNPRLDYYLNNKYIVAEMMALLNSSKYLFIPEEPESGFNMPYIIILPDELYKKENSDFKQYMFFEMSNHIDYNEPFANYISQFIRTFNYKYPLDTIPDQLYSPKVLTFMQQPCLYNQARQEFNMSRLLNREGTLVTLEEFKDYKVCPYDGNGSNSITDNPDTFDETIFKQFIDVELQSKNIIIHSQKIIRELGYPVEDKVFMVGFSGSGAFTNRFTTIYPELLKAVYYGGNIPMILPTEKIDDEQILFPMGVSEHKKFFNQEFNLEKYNLVAKLESLGQNESWSNYPRDNLEAINRLYYSFFGSNGPSQWLSANQKYYSLGAKKTTLFNTFTGHTISKNDAEIIKQFFSNNRNNIEPWYDLKSNYPEHVIFSHLDLDPLRNLVSNFPKPNLLPYFKGNLLLFTSLVGDNFGGPHEEAAYQRFQTTIYLTHELYDEKLLEENNVFIVVYDTKMRSRLKLEDLKINIDIKPNQVRSLINSDGKRVVVIYPQNDNDGSKIIKSLPNDIFSKDQSYLFDGN